jgi:hypothetical protein
MTFIDSFDSGQPNARYDVGLQWDVNVGPNLGDVAVYTALITSEHNQRPKFMAMVSALMQPLADAVALVGSIFEKFDVDTAVGDQLDVIGQYVGVGRQIPIPLTGVFFSWATIGLGWGQGNWPNVLNPTQLIDLPDNNFRVLIRARIAANNWDGTIPGAYEVWDKIFAGTGVGILIQDLGNMHMLLALTGPVPDAVNRALFTGGYLDVKPAGVKIDKYLTPPVDDVPYFGWGVQNENIAGWGSGYWGVQSPGT